MANRDPDTQSATAPTLLFGTAIGLAVLLGESVFALLQGNQLRPLFYLVGFPSYGLFGLMLAVLFFAVVGLAKHLPGALGSLVVNPGVAGSAISVTAILVQGAVVLNELVLSDTSLSSPLSISIDLIWVLLIAALFTLVWFVGRGLPALVSWVALFWGVALASYSISSLYFVIDRPMNPELSVAFTQTLFAFLLVSASLMAPLWTYRVAAANLPRTRVVTRFAPAVTSAALAATLFLVFTTLPADRFESRPVPRPPATEKPNVILIVVDTLRADHLSSYGYRLPTSPRLDEFILDSVKFDDCISPANWTPPGHASIFTGRFPISHGAHKVLSNSNPNYPSCFPLPQAESTIAEILGDHGYRTAAVVANFGFVSPALGLDQGFQFWFDTPPRKLKPILMSFGLKLDFLDGSRFLTDPVPYRRASEIKEISLNWIEEYGNTPFFLFINFMDPHYPYSPPDPWAESFNREDPPFPPGDYIHAVRKGQTELSRIQRSWVSSQYDGEVAYVDSELGNLFSELKKLGHYEDSLIVVTSDHGELLGEHGLFDHQIGLYQPVTRVPLIFKPARRTPKPHGPGRTVQTVDILPTILDSLGMEIPDSIHGSSLFTDEVHPIIAQHYADLHTFDWFGGRFRADHIALTYRGKKLIFISDGTTELFDLVADPREEINLANTDTGTRDQMLASLETWLSDVDKTVRHAKEVPDLDTATIQRLRSLGYVQ